MRGLLIPDVQKAGYEATALPLACVEPHRFLLRQAEPGAVMRLPAFLALSFILALGAVPARAHPAACVRLPVPTPRMLRPRRRS